MDFLTLDNEEGISTCGANIMWDNTLISGSILRAAAMG